LHKKLKFVYLLFSFIVIVSHSAACAQILGPAETGEYLRNAEKEANAFPKDAKRRFQLAEALRNTRDIKKAAIEYLTVTRLDPSYYLAYHQLALCKPSDEQLDEAIDRLNTLEKEKPKALMLRISLSEMLETKGDYYHAARALVDIQYSHTIPEKYLPGINSRIHYLLLKAKDIETLDEAKKPDKDAEAESSPLPLPDNSLDKDLSSSKLKDESPPEGYGHARLLP
jgi:tetratricopeptide (TPR) repeat protein